ESTEIYVIRAPWSKIAVGCPGVHDRSCRGVVGLRIDSLAAGEFVGPIAVAVLVIPVVVLTGSNNQGNLKFIPRTCNVLHPRYQAVGDRLSHAGIARYLADTAHAFGAIHMRRVAIELLLCLSPRLRVGIGDLIHAVVITVVVLLRIAEAFDIPRGRGKR